MSYFICWLKNRLDGKLFGKHNIFFLQITERSFRQNAVGTQWAALEELSVHKSSPDRGTAPISRIATQVNAGKFCLSYNLSFSLFYELACTLHYSWCSVSTWNPRYSQSQCKSGLQIPPTRNLSQSTDFNDSFGGLALKGQYHQHGIAKPTFNARQTTWPQHPRYKSSRSSDSTALYLYNLSVKSGQA